MPGIQNRQTTYPPEGLYSIGENQTINKIRKYCILDDGLLNSQYHYRHVFGITISMSLKIKKLEDILMYLKYFKN